MKSFQREVNAVTVIAAREVVRFFRDWRESLVFSFLFPVLFLGVLGGNIAQNLTGSLSYNYLQFALLGMIANTLAMTTMMSVASLVEDRQNDFTQEFFVAPISRYSIITGKIIGGSITSGLQLFAFVIVAIAMKISLTPLAILCIILLAPVICLSGGALGVLITSVFSSTPKAADQGVILVAFSQMFLSGAIIPINNSSGVLGILARIMPMTYLVDLLRGLVYQGTPFYSKIVLYNPLIHLAAVTAFSVAFFVVGTFLFVRGERNR
ncbi:MAG TPA: ABC transporter permease [Candidatus Limnocylindrales bacterium]|nr:ABC transporter permease [Candidatus Limnocylindrales bacterium]